ncbi:hypothetical protein KIPB_002542 [Kipferlia bialata]|uniref:Uncharacterized protein n=1 Tax=Kipferlia bialata TaxID=797122 RepID=A0A9K3CSY2_9EUKA|nr:hypothetical protein KIPB_002542 [Kipferlia bialata]|eukprot:g2542.t1
MDFVSDLTRLYRLKRGACDSEFSVSQVKLSSVPSLQDIAMEAVAKEFCQTLSFANIPEELQEPLAAFVPLDTPLADIVPVLASDVYWRRRLVNDFGTVARSLGQREPGIPYRQIYLETHLQSFLEGLLLPTGLPEAQSASADEPFSDAGLKGVLEICAPHCKVLRFRHFRSHLCLYELLKRLPHVDTVFASFSSGCLDYARFIGQNKASYTPSLGVLEPASGVDRQAEADMILLTALAGGVGAEQEEEGGEDPEMDPDNLDSLPHMATEGYKVPRLQAEPNEALTCGMLPRDAISLGRALAIPGGIVSSVSLRSSEAGPEQCRAVCLGAMQSEAIRHIDMGYNHIGDTGASLIAETVPLAKLEGVGLAGNGVSVAGCKVLAKVAGKKGTTLSTIDLSSNPIGTEGFEALVTGCLRAVLKHSQRGLSTLCVSSCQIEGVQGLAALCRLLTHGKVTRLEMDGNPLVAQESESAEATRHICEAIEASSQHCRLTVSKCGLTSSDLTLIEQCIFSHSLALQAQAQAEADAKAQAQEEEARQVEE